MEEKIYKPIEEEIPIKDARNDSDLAFSFVLDQVDFLKEMLGSSTQHLQCNLALYILYPRQISYN